MEAVIPNSVSGISSTFGMTTSTGATGPDHGRNSALATFTLCTGTLIGIVDHGAGQRLSLSVFLRTLAHDPFLRVRVRLYPVPWTDTDPIRLALGINWMM